MLAYGQSKIANILFSVGLNNRFASKGINSNALMPGGIVTPIMKYMTKEERINLGIMDADGNPIDNPKMKTTQQGASTTVWACVAPELDGKGGLYFENCQISPERSADDLRAEFLKLESSLPTGICPHAIDEKSADKLWEFSLKAINA